MSQQLLKLASGTCVSFVVFSTYFIYLKLSWLKNNDGKKFKYLWLIKTHKFREKFWKKKKQQNSDYWRSLGTCLILWNLMN